MAAYFCEVASLPAVGVFVMVCPPLALRSTRVVLVGAGAGVMTTGFAFRCTVGIGLLVSVVSVTVATVGPGTGDGGAVAVVVVCIGRRAERCGAGGDNVGDACAVRPCHQLNPYHPPAPSRTTASSTTRTLTRRGGCSGDSGIVFIGGTSSLRRTGTAARRAVSIC